MMICNRFKNDPDWIQQLQHDLYWSVVILPFEMAKPIYLKAERTLGIETQLGKDCRDVGKIDHRAFQFFHDAIATKYRYELEHPLQYRLPCIIDGETEEDDIKKEWFYFYKKQIEHLFDDYQNLPQQILVAGTYPDPDERGRIAENNINMICKIMNSDIK